MNLLIIVTFILTLLGLFMLIWHFAGNSRSTSAEQGYPWGLFISGYIFFANAGAGLLIAVVIASLLRPDLVPAVAKTGPLLVAGFTIAALLLLLANSGRPLVFVKYFYRFNSQSPLAWGSLATVLCLLVALVTLLVSTGDRGWMPLCLLVIALAVSFFQIISISSFFLFAPGAISPYRVISLIVKSLLEGSVLLWYAGLFGSRPVSFDDFIVSILLILIIADLVISAISMLLRYSRPDIYSVAPSLLVLIIVLFPLSGVLPLTLALVVILISGVYERHKYVKESQKFTYKLPEGMFYQKGDYKASIKEGLIFIGMFGMALFIGSLGVFL